MDKLGETVPLDLTFVTMEGESVLMSDLLTKPTVLTLVYYRCPNICSPLLQELGDAVEKCDLEPGVDYNLLTISFDDREGPDLSTIAHNTIVGLMEREIQPDGWKFMTGDFKNITGITSAVGFQYSRIEEDYAHPASVIFLSKEGKIVRYLNGLEFLPADIKLAVLDAKEGRARSFMEKIQRVCYTYDPVGKKYFLRINHIILYVSLFLAVSFALFLTWQGKQRKLEIANSSKNPPGAAGPTAGLS
ncbi:MAG: SCO family protein [Planctomycetes bacterium]|nr:SCO family protein [Planctomycetota bacterium]